MKPDHPPERREPGFLALWVLLAALFPFALSGGGGHPRGRNNCCPTTRSFC